MRTKAIAKYLGFVLLFNALFLYISAAISLFLHENSLSPLLYSAVVCTILGLFPQIFVEKIDEINFREGMAISVFGWILTCLAGAVPYFMWGGEFTFVNALFESVSGYTTTGATVLKNVEALTKGLLFWRASTHFIGGVGIILFVLLILPSASGARSSIYNSELSGLSKLNFKIRTKQIARVIVVVYLSLILIEIVLLWILGMSLFDAICHAFATVATGGFSTKNLSVAYYNNVWIEVVIMVFMLLGSIHFGLLYGTVTGNKMNIFTSKSVRAYVGLMFLGIIIVAAKLTNDGFYSWWTSLRYASFQVISLGTTTGFATVDTPNWPIFTIIIIMYFTIQCGMVGSTAGGLKFDRVLLFYKSLKRQIKLVLHPSGVYITKLENVPITTEMELQTAIFFILYLFTLFITALLLSGMNVDGITSISASIATIGNAGPGFGDVSSLGNYSSIPDAGKYVLSANMLLGRLEIINVFALFTVLTHKK
ncbi:MAG TPA: TrkH family potassium uptake protein [Petrimonas sp.]|uniref:TrkH family potassium uptake protein n=1 Tax=Petrimonas sp. TaxID=2023866 RepID=UPI000A8AE816|nr:TrkH family potassium uptake protein [Petrimonas sp.]MEA4948099.1 TrkH family potassium uptake protein [Petrimonas sp.]MEA4980160.1 TrkH family potassium uptake protein [Petrimonas sp.]MEA5046624.1 TrkH family potassium uptake protein [Petrimonas sp.]MEA5063793.1 TrkH family potassium uptake protein [Petrimonas sp.]